MLKYNMRKMDFSAAEHPAAGEKCSKRWAFMIQIGLCDDDLAILSQLQVLLGRYQVERNAEITSAAFQSPLELLAEIEKGMRFDILLLDVLMPGENGIDAAREIRRYDNNVKIIFLTSSSEFAVESYTVGAYFYQLKPIWEENFFRLMDAVIAECEKSGGMSLILRCKSGITRVELNRLEYCEVLGRSLWLHLVGGAVLESAGRMDHLCEQLADHENFLRVHRSFLINLDYVKNIVPKAITMASLAELPIPRGKYAELKDRYLEYAFQRKQVFL